jgi:hypothetical protein
MSAFADWVNLYGFPIVAAVGLGYFIYYIWVWATTKVKPVLGAAMGDLIALVDRIRMLDNDLIRLTQKLNSVLEFKEEYEKMTGKKMDIDLDDIQQISESDNDRNNKRTKGSGKTTSGP